MSEILENDDNLRIMESLVSGESVVINYSELGRKLSKNRGTIQERVERLIKNNIITPPSFPFYHLFTAYPLLLLTNMDIPDCVECQPRIKRWIQDDPKIIAAYKFRQGEYGTLIFTLHKDLKEAHEWLSVLPHMLETVYGVEKEHATFNSNTIYISNELLLKYDPSTSINILERDSQKGEVCLNGHCIDQLDVSILRYLLTGKGIKYNRNRITQTTGLHSRTVEKRVDQMLKEKVLLEPVCRFPELFMPPGYLLSYMLVHLEHPMNAGLNSLLINENIPIIWKTIHSKYNLLMFHIHTDLHDLYGDIDVNRESYKILEKAQARYLAYNSLKGFSPKKLSLQHIESKIKETKDQKK
ncbi:MAG: hypothetical protein NWF07_01720 [Candidatus Bathyarchaeota archaeon]|nr:hypothetical protein [Candidatus Bathyarchaeota archaeon]